MQRRSFLAPRDILLSGSSSVGFQVAAAVAAAMAAVAAVAAAAA
jgi:hypothetical protein